MAHWGWYWKHKKKHKSKTTCSSLLSIDSFKLYKGSQSAASFTVEPINVRATLQEEGLSIIYGNSKNSAYIIPLDRLPCNYGGYRYFFKCPLCNCRMRKLYFAQRSLFLCRKCLNLTYDTQLLRPMRRYYRMTKKIETMVEEMGGNLSIHKKPYRMWNKTFHTLQRKHSYYEQMDRNASNQELRTWYGPAIEPELDTFFDYVPEKSWPHKSSKNKEVSPVM